ncbi:TPA: hypothetical protein J4Z76_001320 [Escherichia coli]|nr:hypothetical protein [Escherichia coli]HCQ0091584.1 hypothetical protein [Escherichia coli]
MLEITLNPFATCNRFKAGHRIRFDIAGSYFPHFDINPNNGLPAWPASEWRVAKNNVWCGPAPHPA